MAMVEPETAQALQIEIQKIEQWTDLKRVAVISRVGMKVATASSDRMDADAETASSSALIELADRLTEAVNHGNLREILVKGESGFVILQFINNDYMLFGGIENPMRIGFYLEYLRNATHRFAYILAGNQLTDELKHEIEANQLREKRLQEEAQMPLAQNFQMDKDASQDMEAMEGVLSFLNDWGREEESPSKPTTNNVVGIDQDVMFGMDELAPQPISQDQISEAQKFQKPTGESVAPSSSPSTDLSDIAALASDIAKTTPKPSSKGTQPISESAPEKTSKSETQPEVPEDIMETLEAMAQETTVEPTEPPTMTPSSMNKSESLQPQTTEPIIEQSETEAGLPDDILAALDNIAAQTEASTPITEPSVEKKEEFPYGVPLYDGEVPPVPLEDYINFEIGTLAAGTTETQTQEPTTNSMAELDRVDEIESSDFEEDIVFKDDGTPDFDQMSSEYDDDFDLEDGEEDAMLSALEELEFVEEKEKQKKKNKQGSNNNPFLS